MSETLSLIETQRAAELANLANQVYQNDGGNPKNGWEKVITSSTLKNPPSKLTTPKSINF